MILIAKQKNKSEAAVKKFDALSEAMDLLIEHNGNDEELCLKTSDLQVDLFDKRVEESMGGIGKKEPQPTQLPNATYTNGPQFSFKADVEDIDDLKRVAELALKKLSELNKEITRINAHLAKLQKECTNQRDFKEISCWIIVIAAIWAISKRFYQRRASTDNENEWHCINQLLSRNHAEVRMADLQRIINKYHDELGHIKTAGKGRTKNRIIDDLRAFQMGLNV